MLAGGIEPVPAGLDRARLAALASAANVALNTPDSYLLKIRGDSMIDAMINDGEVGALKLAVSGSIELGLIRPDFLGNLTFQLFAIVSRRRMPVITPAVERLRAVVSACSATLPSSDPSAYPARIAPRQRPANASPRVTTAILSTMRHAWPWWRHHAATCASQPGNRPTT